MLYKYRFWCTECLNQSEQPGTYVETGYFDESLPAPTTCPNNTAHEVQLPAVIIDRIQSDTTKLSDSEGNLISNSNPFPTGALKTCAAGLPFKVHSSDFSDKTTWYQGSVRVTGETLTDSGDGLTFNFANTHIINMDAENLTAREGKLLKIDGTFGTRDEFALTVFINGQSAGGNDISSIDYVNGSVTFASSQTGNTITANYNYADSNVFKVRPPSGYMIKINRAKVVLTDEPEISQTLFFDLFAGDPTRAAYSLGSYNPYNQFAFRYRALEDFFLNCDEFYGPVATGHYVKGLIQFTWNYDTVILIKDSQFAELWLGIENGNELNIEYGAIMFSCELIPE